MRPNHNLILNKNFYHGFNNTEKKPGMQLKCTNAWHISREYCLDVSFLMFEQTVRLCKLVFAFLVIFRGKHVTILYLPFKHINDYILKYILLFCKSLWLLISRNWITVNTVCTLPTWTWDMSLSSRVIKLNLHFTSFSFYLKGKWRHINLA